MTGLGQGPQRPGVAFLFYRGGCVTNKGSKVAAIGATLLAATMLAGTPVLAQRAPAQPRGAAAREAQGPRVSIPQGTPAAPQAVAPNAAGTI